MIRLKCPSCGSRLSAKRQLAGQTRNCPKCGTPVQIVPAEGQAESSPPEQAAAPSAPAEQLPSPSQSGLPVHHWPERLDRQHHYLICDKAKLVAAWESDGNGWMLKTHTGFVSAARNREQLPTQGEFKLVELQIQHTPSGRRLRGIKSYQLASRWALTCLDKGDDQIMAKIAGLAGLSRDQKNAVRGALKSQFMGEVWGDADKVLAYLANNDFHSPGAE